MEKFKPTNAYSCVLWTIKRTRFRNWKTKVNKTLEHGARVRQTRPHPSISMARRDGALISMRAYLSAADVFYPLPQTLLLRNYLSSFWALHMKQKASAGFAVNSSISLAADGGSSWTETSKQVRHKLQNFRA